MQSTLSVSCRQLVDNHTYTKSVRSNELWLEKKKESIQRKQWKQYSSLIESSQTANMFKNDTFLGKVTKH